MAINTVKRSNPVWFSELSHYSKSNSGKAVWQLANTIIPYIFLWILMVYLIKHNYSYWWSFGLTLLAGGFLVRIFIIFHDSCHGSLLPTRKANRIIGYITGILAFTPFEKWRRLHNIHHLHHLRPRIPNYNLQKCYDNIAELKAVQPLTIRKSLRSLRLNLWDEETKKMVSFAALKNKIGLHNSKAFSIREKSVVTS